MWMGTSEIVAIVIAGVSYLTAIINIYVQMRIKFKELDVKIISVQNELTEFKKKTENTFDRIVETNIKDHQRLYDKIDELIKIMYDLNNVKGNNNKNQI